MTSKLIFGYRIDEKNIEIPRRYDISIHYGIYDEKTGKCIGFLDENYKNFMCIYDDLQNKRCVVFVDKNVCMLIDSDKMHDDVEDTPLIIEANTQIIGCKIVKLEPNMFLEYSSLNS